MASKLRWTGADLTAAAINRHFHRNLRAWEHSRCVQLPSQRNCTSSMLDWHSCNVLLAFTVRISYDMRGCEWRLLFPLRPKLERFRQAYANKIAWATHLAWGDHSSQHHFLVISIYTLEIVDFSLPLSSIFLVVELFDLGSAWFEPLAAWQEYARSSMMQSSIFRFFFFLVLWCSEYMCSM